MKSGPIPTSVEDGKAFLSILQGCAASYLHATKATNDSELNKIADVVVAERIRLVLVGFDRGYADRVGLGAAHKAASTLAGHFGSIGISYQSSKRKKDLYKKAYTDDPKKFDNLAWDDKVGIVKALKELNYGVDHESTVVKQTKSRDVIAAEMHLKTVKKKARLEEEEAGKKVHSKATGELRAILSSRAQTEDDEDDDSEEESDPSSACSSQKPIKGKGMPKLDSAPVLKAENVQLKKEKSLMAAELMTKGQFCQTIAAEKSKLSEKVVSLRSDLTEAQKELKGLKKNLGCIVPIDDEVYSATIIGFNSDGTFRIDYGDGDQVDITFDQIQPIIPPPPMMTRSKSSGSSQGETEGEVETEISEMSSIADASAGAAMEDEEA